MSEVSVELGGARISPPSGVDGDPAGFMMAGLRGSRLDVFGTGVYGALLVGRSIDPAAGGDFVSGELGGAKWWRLGRSWSTGLEGRAFGFRVVDPFSYDAGAAEGSLTLRYRAGFLRARLAGTGGAGRSRVGVSTVVQRMRRQTLVTDVLVDDLWRYGTSLEVLAGGGPLAVGLAGGVHRSAGGAFSSVGLRIVGGALRGALELRLDRWRTPEGYRNTGGIAFYMPWGGWSARGSAGRPEPDPLLLAEPGREAGGLLVARRLFGRSSGPGPARSPLHRVVEETPSGARVQFTVEVPDGSREVELLGDFTLWEPVAMQSRGGRWTVEMDVPSGVYHFGFLVDGDWYLPDDAADAAPDEWGRRSATLVIEGAAKP